MLNKEQRNALRGLGNAYPDLVFVGKDGVTENIVKQVNDNLFAHELIKIKVQNNAPKNNFEISEELEDKCDCDIVTVIGSKILLYKASEKSTNKELAKVREVMANCKK